MIKLTGLWKGTTEAGQSMLSGNISPTTKLVILTNQYAKGDNDPTHIAFIVDNKKKEAAPPENDEF